MNGIGTDNTISISVDYTIWVVVGSDFKTNLEA